MYYIAIIIETIRHLCKNRDIDRCTSMESPEMNSYLELIKFLTKFLRTHNGERMVYFIDGV